MITAKSTIEREAAEAAAAGHTIDEACRYPFGSPAAEHFKAVYLLALPLACEVRARMRQPTAACKSARCTAYCPKATA